MPPQNVIDLLDIIEPAAVIETVNIRGTDFQVRGVSNREYANLLRRFPMLDPVEPAPVLPRADVIDADADLKRAVVAIGFGCPGNEEVEARIEAKFSREEMQTLSDTIFRLTNPPSAGPLAPGAAEPQPANANPGKAADGALSSSSTNSSGTDTPAPM